MWLNLSAKKRAEMVGIKNIKIEKTKSCDSKFA